jgi:hypothetical protein
MDAMYEKWKTPTLDFASDDFLAAHLIRRMSRFFFLPGATPALLFVPSSLDLNRQKPRPGTRGSHEHAYELYRGHRP